jgi:FKBP-type peptidyl-prolyl cis-trans isomerase FklB
MKKLSITLAFVLSLGVVFAQNTNDKSKVVPIETPIKVAPGKAPAMPQTPIKVNPSSSKIVLKTAQDSASYAYGVVMAQSLKRQLNNDLNRDMLMEGLNAALKEEQLLIAQEECQPIFGAYNKQIQAKAGEKTKTEGIVHLEKNKKKSGVITTATGLQYEVITKSASSTISPKATDKVKVHYHGTLLDGSEFDSSVTRGQPAEFGLNQVIKGWTEGVQLMHVGDKFKFTIPYELAYGERAAGPKIKPYSCLVFEIELLEIKAQ